MTGSSQSGGRAMSYMGKPCVRKIARSGQRKNLSIKIENKRLNDYSAKTYIDSKFCNVFIAVL